MATKPVNKGKHPEFDVPKAYDFEVPKSVVFEVPKMPILKFEVPKKRPKNARKWRK